MQALGGRGPVTTRPCSRRLGGSRLRAWAVGAVLAVVALLLAGCSPSGDGADRATHVVDSGDLFSKRQASKLERIEPSHDGDTYVITYPVRSPGAVTADEIIRGVISDSDDPGDCGRTGIFILISRRGPPQLRVGSKWSTGALETGLTYGATYLRTQRQAAKTSPYAQARELARKWSTGAAAGLEKARFLDGLVSDAAGGFLAPDYTIGSGIIARTQRYVSSTVSAAFDRQSGPIEAIVAFAVVGSLGSFLLNRRRGISGSIARPVFAALYVAVSIPVGYGVITLLGYRGEDRISYSFDRSSLKLLYDADVWAPIGNWWVLAAIGIAFLLATVLTVVPFAIVMIFSDEMRRTDLGQDNWLLINMLETAPDQIVTPLLRSLALPFALIWAAHAFLPALITYLLVLPAILLLPWRFMDALQWFRIGQRFNLE